MTADCDSNPYRPPESSRETVLTPRRYTPGQCFLRFMFAGALSGVFSGPAAVVANAAGGPVAMILIVPGILFGIAFWLTTAVYIGKMSPMRMAGLISGCLAGFIVTGAVYDTSIPFVARMGSQWTWQELRACIYGPAAGMLIISGVVRVIGGFMQYRVLMTVWLAGTCIGFSSFFAFHELDARTNDQEAVLFVAIVFFQTTLLGLMGWQLATARAKAWAATQVD